MYKIIAGSKLEEITFGAGNGLSYIPDSSMLILHGSLAGALEREVIWTPSSDEKEIVAFLTNEEEFLRFCIVIAKMLNLHIARIENLKYPTFFFFKTKNEADEVSRARKKN